LEHIYPNFDQIIEKSLEFSGNLILFLPRNTSIEEIVNRLLPFHDQLTYQPDKLRSNELVLEIEELQYGNYCKGLIVSTGKLAKVYPHEITALFISQFCHEFTSSA
jgi:hypothetical protein